MRFTVTIDSDNEAVTPLTVAWMLTGIVERLEDGEEPRHTQSIFDVNGNRVGSWKLELGDE